MCPDSCHAGQNHSNRHLNVIVSNPRLSIMGEVQRCSCDKREKIRVEVARKTSDLSGIQLRLSVKLMLKDMSFREEPMLVPTPGESLSAHVTSIRFEKVRRKICHLCRPIKRTTEYHPPCGFDLANSELDIVIYKLAKDWLMEEEDEESGISMATITLPAEEFDGLWEDLVYDTPVKEELVCYAQGLLALSQAGVRPSVTGINRLLLFHGEPGTGKTSICRALAQKLSIILCGQEKFTCGKFVEINANSLFSKYFSESGKLVQKLFSEIRTMLTDPSVLVFVLIDEIESLAMSRSLSGNGSDPGDASRVVNALLTQIDSLKMQKNLLILTTSNLTDKIDPAFRDRADMEVYIGPPSAMARYAMLYVYLQELQHGNMVIGTMPLPPSALQKSLCAPGGAAMHMGNTERLWRLAVSQEGMSGRGLKKIVALTYSFFLTADQFINMETFLSVLEDTAAIVREQKGVRAMSTHTHLESAVVTTPSPCDEATHPPTTLPSTPPTALPSTPPTSLCHVSECLQLDGDIKMSIDEPTTVVAPYALCG